MTQRANGGGGYQQRVPAQTGAFAGRPRASRAGPDAAAPPVTQRLAALQTLAEASGPTRALAQLQQMADRGAAPVQRQPFVQGNDGGNVDIGPGAMSLAGLVGFMNAVEGDDAKRIAADELRRRLRALPPSEEFRQGMFSGSYESREDRNWADLHVTGQLGGSMQPADLVTIFQDLYNAMSAHHRESGVVGTLEWHPTGAVVTKQLVELLGESLGSWSGWGKARLAKEKRKRGTANPELNRMAEKIAPAIVPEHLHYLKSLRGVPGLSIAAPAGMPDPAGYAGMTPDEKLAARSQSMISDDAPGDARLAQYAGQLADNNAPGPSLAIKMDHTKLPKLIAKLQAV